MIFDVYVVCFDTRPVASATTARRIEDQRMHPPQVPVSAARFAYPVPQSPSHCHEQPLTYSVPSTSSRTTLALPNYSVSSFQRHRCQISSLQLNSNSSSNSNDDNRAFAPAVTTIVTSIDPSSRDIEPYDFAYTPLFTRDRQRPTRTLRLARVALSQRSCRTNYEQLGLPLTTHRRPMPTTQELRVHQHSPYPYRGKTFVAQSSSPTTSDADHR